MPGPEPADADIEILKLVNRRPEGFATASDIVDDTQVGRKQTRNRLNALVDDGLLKSRTVGTTNVYWLADAGEDVLRED